MQITRTDTTAILLHTHFTLTLIHAHQQLRYVMQSPTAAIALCEGVLGDIQCNHRAIKWQTLTVADPVAHPDGTTTVAIVADADGLQLQLVMQFYAEHTMMRTWGTLHNLGTQSWTVTDCAIVHLIFPQAPLYLFHVDQFSWVYRRDFFSQHQSQIWPGRTPIEIRMGSYPSHYDGATSCGWFAMRPPPTTPIPSPRIRAAEWYVALNLMARAGYMPGRHPPQPRYAIVLIRWRINSHPIVYLRYPVCLSEGIRATGTRRGM